MTTLSLLKGKLTGSIVLAFQTPTGVPPAAVVGVRCLESTMPPKMNCPACGSDMRSRGLISHYSLKPYRVCPDCGAKYTADPKTKQRQLPIIVLVLIALGSTAAVGLKGTMWLLPAILSNIVLWCYVGYAVSRVKYVQHCE
jgi:uncharacterized protein (DUF983 family)